MSFDAAFIRADRISKSYEGVRALRDVCFELRAGEVHALVGEKRGREVDINQDHHWRDRA